MTPMKNSFHTALLVLFLFLSVSACSLADNTAADYNNRGNAKQEKGDIDGAITDFNQAIEINPKYSEAYNNRGDAKLATGDLNGSIDDYNRAIEINPKYSIAYYNRGCP